MALAATLIEGLAQAQVPTTERVSVNTAGAEGHGYSSNPSVSASGRFVAFYSDAADLVAVDTNGFGDVFVRDRQSGTTELVSVDSGGLQGSDQSAQASISSDGRFVAFYSAASNLVAVDTNGWADIFVRDRLNLTTECVSLATSGAQGNNYSGGYGGYVPSISADGRFVAFVSLATNLVANDMNGSDDIFVRDLLLGTTERVSVATGGGEGDDRSLYPSISADGGFVAFYSHASNLVTGDTNGTWDVFVRDRQSGTTERVSVGPGGAQGNDESSKPSISADGRFVAFRSLASNLVAVDTNMNFDVFVHDRQVGGTELVSVDSVGTQGNDESGGGGISISSDGRFAAFESNASNLVAVDTNGRQDVFMRDRQSGTTERVSVDSAGVQGDWDSNLPWVSSDGRFVAFTSGASNLVPGDTNADFDVFVRDRGAPPPVAFCFGDGSAGPCPCGNNGASGRGCENSASSGGALLSATGNSSLASDTLLITSAGELPHAPSIFLQGSVAIAGVNFGDGLRCVSQSLKRMYVHSASGGVVRAPQPGDLSISARSAALGDAVSAGTTRYYQTYYRDPSPTFCANPPGNGWNVSSGLSVTWAQ